MGQRMMGDLRYGERGQDNGVEPDEQPPVTDKEDPEGRALSYTG